ncbi:uncharacterized protein LOC125178462, partial [Hyalella azteca]|uniref:Uncharacterized protein LOC125178462 n=1 Tax=Hyalella azteca TaxID=294128 RepID=A0A979FNW5_HYAAZ
FDSPTLSALVNLTVYELPSQLVIQDWERKPVLEGMLGPLMEGHKLTLYCVAAGGRPPPRVSWWSGTTLLADRSFVIGHDGTILSSQEIDVTVRNTMSYDAGKQVPGLGLREGSGPPYVVTELIIPSLTRDHTNFSCSASNTNLTAPIVRTVALTVYLHPTHVKISSATHEALQEGREARLDCEAEGAWPATNITWSKTVAGTTEQLPSTMQQAEGRSVSRLRLVPEFTDHGAKILCRAFNPHLPGPGVATTVSLNVKFAPRVGLHLGTSLAGRPINEAEDVYFECEVQSNPSPRTIEWRRDVSTAQPAHHRVEARLLPVCAVDPVIVAVGEGEKVKLECRVDAHPVDQLRFTWFFNNTLDTKEVHNARISVAGGSSSLHYTPTTPRDYGTLSCWATNQVGTQAEPCTFTVVEAGPPESVRDCMLVNHTLGALEVRCAPGGDGGSPQRFVAKVFASPTHTQLATLEASLPKFHVTGLVPGQDYLVTITAVNDKGASEPQQIDAIRLKVAEKRMGEVSAPSTSPLVGVFLGLVGGFLVLLLVVVLLTRRARSNGSVCSNHSM